MFIAALAIVTCYYYSLKHRRSHLSCKYCNKVSCGPPGEEKRCKNQVIQSKFSRKPKMLLILPAVLKKTLRVGKLGYQRGF